ncbi:unnamed protein product [Rhodiola kirilowii]
MREEIFAASTLSCTHLGWFSRNFHIIWFFVAGTLVEKSSVGTLSKYLKC